MKKMYLIKSSLNLLFGIVILCFRSFAMENLEIIIGIFMIIVGAQEGLYHLIKKDFMIEKDTLYTPIVIFILGFIILFADKNRVDFICIIWGVIIIIRCCRQMNESLYNSFKHLPFIVPFIEDAFSFVLAIMLILNPQAHAYFHLTLLGIEFILEFLRNLLKIYFLDKKPKKVEEEVKKHDEIMNLLESKKENISLKNKNKNS